MRGGALPPALLCAALGLALAFATSRARLVGLLALVLSAIPMAFVPVDPAWKDAVFDGCWVGVILAAASVHLPRGLGARTAAILALNGGLWAGAVIAEAGTPVDLAKSLPVALISFPGAWIVGRGRGIFLKVAAGWLIAIALLAWTLALVVPTPGYVPDHMD